jgi:hypothetical protein
MDALARRQLALLMLTFNFVGAAALSNTGFEPL